MSDNTEKLAGFFRLLINQKVDIIWLRNHLHLFDEMTPEMIVDLVDQMYREDFPMGDLKTGVNKFINLCFNALNNSKQQEYSEGSVFNMLVKDNAMMEQKLHDLRPLIKGIQSDPSHQRLSELRNRFIDLTEVDGHYKIIENVIFPIFEKHIQPYRCVMIMWSFHDDIRRNLKSVIKLLDPEYFDRKDFNKLAGLLYFNMFAMKLREEKILFPLTVRILTEIEQISLLNEALEIGFGFIKQGIAVPIKEIMGGKLESVPVPGEIDLKTGFLDPEHIRLIFNHLPVDITFVDQNDIVRYFSTPPHRVFTRTNAIIGRKVQNCHPHESLHIVNEIIGSFRSGEKDMADFWINMSDKTYLIRYFAVRNEESQYCGIIEVTQDITGIKTLQGEKRLLNWED